MEVIVPLLVQLIGGGAGGNVVGQLIKQLNLGTLGNTVAGALGGVGGTWLATMIPGLSGMLGSAAVAGGTSAGMDFSALAGQGVAGLVGGGVLTAIAGFVKNSVMKAS